MLFRKVINFWVWTVKQAATGWRVLMFYSLACGTHMVAACRLDSRMSMLFFEGESSSTGEINPSTSSSRWSRNSSMLISGRTVSCANSVLSFCSSSEPSSSSCTDKVFRLVSEMIWCRRCWLARGSSGAFHAEFTQSTFNLIRGWLKRKSAKLISYMDSLRDPKVWSRCTHLHIPKSQQC